MQSDWAIIVPQMALSAGGLFIFCIGAFWKKRPAGLLFKLAIASAIISGLGAALIKPETPDFFGFIDGSDYARFFTVLFSLITVMTLLFAEQYVQARGFSGDEFYGVMLFAALGMALVGSAAHWLTFFLGLEMLSISLYILIAAPRSDAAAGEAALKYFIMGSVASGFLTFGIAMLYSVTGKMQIGESLRSAAGNEAGAMLGIGLILAGIGFKVSLVPFHLWTPDVYQGAPAPVTAFLSTGSKAALYSALLRFAMTASDGIWAHLAPVLWALAALTMIVGNVTALAQTHLKRLLAYSSIAHMGYLLTALLAVKEDGASAVMFYLAVYTLMDLGAFGTIAGLSATGSDRDALDDYRGLGYSRPWHSALLALCLLSLAGLPPTAGFIGKFIIFQSVIRAGYLTIAIIGISTAIVSVYYYLKVIVALYMRAEEAQPLIPRADIHSNIATGTMLLLILWLGIMPSSLLPFISRILAAFSV